MDFIANAAKRWQGALVDDSGRNQLAYYRDLRVGTLPLSGARPTTLAQLLAGRAVTLKQLFPEKADHTDALKRVRAIRKHMRTWAEERGVDVGYVVTGLATWTEDGRTPRSPVLLQRLDVRPSSATQVDFVLDTDPEPTLNPVLLYKLEKEHGLFINPEELADLEPAELFAQLRKLAADVPGFNIQSESLAGTFTYAKLPMVDDIAGSIEVLRDNDVISALAGDPAALSGLVSATAVSADAPDHTPPADEFLVLDADSSQSYAVNAVLGGQHLVIKGPPGTGKSQTIANIIATLAARGRTSLFVAEKRAAIDAVLDRLTHVGLDDLVHNLHGEQQSRRELARSLEARLQRARVEAQPLTGESDRRLVATREPLVHHHRAMHEVRHPWGLSVYDIQARLIGVPPTAVTAMRWTGDLLNALHGANAAQVRASIADLAGIPSDGPWAATTLTDRASAQTAFALARETSAQWSQALGLLRTLCAEVGLPPVNTVAGAESAARLVLDVRQTLANFKPECYTVEIGPFDRGFFARRKAQKQLRAIWIGKGKPTVQHALAIADQKQRWARAAGPATPGTTASDAAFGGSRPKAGTTPVEPIMQAIAALGRLRVYVPVPGQALGEVQIQLDELAADQRGLLDAVRRNELRAVLTPWRALDLASEHAFDYAWCWSVLDHLRFADDELSRFNGPQLHSTVDQFRQADTAHIGVAAARVRHAAALRMIDILDEYPEQQRLVRNEAAKKTRHLPIRKLFEQAPDALTALKPCWAMSPLLASQVLPAKQLFDVVIFDEASQVEPVDAITAIMRGRQVVVAGDEHQLPPSDFWHRSESDLDLDDEDYDAPLTQDIESLLQSFAGALPLSQVKHLAWHYRSRDERLIAFSNAQIYAPNGNELVTFPGADTAGCVQHVLATGDESQRVVELMLEHARLRPEESLGVIAMGSKQADLIDAALRKALGSNPDVAAFFTESGREPYFIKNLERVQGDERDAIILSIGYGKTADGRMRYTFGPLNLKGGQRRLNVAITRAKRRVTVVSSFTSADMDPAKLQAEGAKLIRSYLEYAESGGTRIASSSAPAMNPLAADIFQRLTEAGIPLVAQYGVSGYRVDFAASHPDDPQRMVLAIEADGASYHASPTARDRDRLRQRHLETLGWRFHRIWSTDWFADRTGEVARTLAAYQEALTLAPVKPLVPPTVLMRQPSGRRDPRPELPPFDGITDIPHTVLADFVGWIESDGLNRTEDELVAETVAELGFTRRGSRMTEAILRARE